MYNQQIFIPKEKYLKILHDSKFLPQKNNISGRILKMPTINTNALSKLT